jgi:serine/threonine-protein kinase
MKGLNTRLDADEDLAGNPESACSSSTQVASTTEAQAIDNGNEVLLDLLERWDQLYRCGQDPTPESLGVTDPAILELVRQHIDRQRRLYAILDAPRTNPNEADRTSEPLPFFPGYEIESEVGRGGMGVVYKARDKELDRLVAIKTIAGGEFATAAQRERFRAEAHAVARLQHPNIIAIHAIHEHERRPYLALEFADGGNLAQRLADKPMHTGQAAELVETLATAVQAAHREGIIHRDLKPSNVLLTADGVPKLSDFGLAKLLDTDSRQTRTGQPLGTPSYMAPEQTGERADRVGPQTDVYGLGAILYEALTGRPPFLGGSAMETMRLLNSTEVVPPRQSRPEVPKDLETICLKCLQKEPQKRYANALALANDLRLFLEGRPISARPISSLERLRRWCWRKPMVAGSLAAVIVILLISSVVSGTLAVRAIRAEERTGKERDRAESEAAVASAVTEFLRKDLLARSGPRNQAGLGTRPDPDLKLRTVLDAASKTIGARFAAQPRVEAAIRQTLGETYQQLGLYPQALQHLQRALVML